MFRQQLMSVGDNFCPSPRQVASCGAGRPAQPACARGMRQPAPPLSPRGPEAQAALSARTPPRSPPRRSSSRGRMMPAVSTSPARSGSRGRTMPTASATPASNNASVVVVEITRQLWEMEERWQRICAETAALKAVLHSPSSSKVAVNAGDPGGHAPTRPASKQTIASLETGRPSACVFERPPLSPVQSHAALGAGRDSSAAVEAACAAANAAVRAAAAFSAQAVADEPTVPTVPMRALPVSYPTDTLDETRLCGTSAHRTS